MSLSLQRSSVEDLQIARELANCLLLK